MLDKIRNYYPPGLDLLTFSMMFGMFIYVLFSYSSLPAEIPIQYNAAGEAIQTGGKDTLFGLMVVNFHVIALIFILNYFLIIRSDDTANSLVNIPFLNKKKLSTEQVRSVKTNIARMLAFTNLAISLMFAIIYYEMVQSGLGESSGFGILFSASVVLIFVPAFYYLRKTYQEVKNGSGRSS